jgi:hypothetical protein
MPGSAASVPGVSVSRAAGFASGMPLDVAPGGLVLARLAEDAAGRMTGTPVRPMMRSPG